MVHHYQAMIRHHDSHGLSEEEEEWVKRVIQEKLNLLFNAYVCPSYTSLSPLLEYSEIGQEYNFHIGNSLGTSGDDRPFVIVDLIRPRTSNSGVSKPGVMATRKPAMLVDFCGGPGAGAGAGVVHADADPAAPLVFAAAIVIALLFLTFF